MAIKNEASALFHEKQDLDNFLSSLKAIRLPGDIMQGRGAVNAEAEKSSLVVGLGRSLYLIREKEETDIFLSHVIAVKPPDEVIKEKAVPVTEADEQSPVSDDLSGYYKTEESQFQSYREDQPSEDEQEKIVIATRSKEDMQISFTLPEDKRAAEESSFGDKDRKEEQLQTGDQDRKDKSVFVQEPPGLAQVQKDAAQMYDIANVPPSAKVEIAAQAVIEKSKQIARIALEKPAAKKIERPGKIIPEPAKKKSKHLSWGTSMLLVLLLVVVVVMQGYLWMYPEAGYQTIEWMHSNFPMMDQLLGVEKVQKQDIITDQVEFINVRQHFVKNESLGNLRVIEGEVVNLADFPIAKIKVMGELFDSNDALLAARISYCGNILQDETLSRFKEEEIRSILSVSSGGDSFVNKILPKGQIPFMIVFTHEPPGVAKATVTTIGAERISP
ncbi:MAG TPA: DUF3426 domain-containing protein [Syntrophales bacterium]|nr:DUF3426 domain-containing protein [Syntrophales bacterium]